MMKPVRTVKEVVEARLCIGCGACAALCPDSKISLRDVYEEGIRPILADTDCGDCRKCVEVCPSVHTDFGVPWQSEDLPAIGDRVFRRDWGRVLEIWEGGATDPGIRFRGSSGGALTALAAYCIGEGGLAGVLHVGQDPDCPVRNRTLFSRTREALLAAAGSRYSPASVCDRLDLVREAPAPCAVIGRPSEIAALRKAQAMDPALDGNVGLALSFFCAESPSTAGTVALLEKLGIPPESLADLRYRGNGWPGRFAPILRGDPEARRSLPYRESWRFLQSYRPWSVHLWPDGTGELADLCCGDPWYEKPDGRNPGSSLVVVRTEKGRRILAGAMAAGYLTLRPAEPWKLVGSQRYLVSKKASTWGRLLAMRSAGMHVPCFRGAHLFRCWLRLPAGEKLRSYFGTIRRILQRKLYRRPNIGSCPSPGLAPGQDAPARPAVDALRKTCRTTSPL